MEVREHENTFLGRPRNFKGYIMSNFVLSVASILWVDSNVVSIHAKHSEYFAPNVQKYCFFHEAPKKLLKF